MARVRYVGGDQIQAYVGLSVNYLKGHDFFVYTKEALQWVKL